MTKPTPKPLRFALQSAPRIGAAALVLARCATPAAYFAAESIDRTAVLQVVVRALESGLLATGPSSSRTGSGLARIRQEAGLIGTGSVARKQTGALMTFSA